MSRSRELRGLVALRDVQEQQAALRLESAIKELRRLEREWGIANARSSVARELVRTSAKTGQLEDRLSGLQEIVSAELSRRRLAMRVRSANQVVERTRFDAIAKRVEKRQAEILLENALNQDALRSLRREGMALEEWKRHRTHKRLSEPHSALPTGSDGLDHRDSNLQLEYAEPASTSF